MGRRFGEHDLLQVGAALEAAMPVLTPMDPVRT
jgi:amidase